MSDQRGAESVSALAEEPAGSLRCGRCALLLVPGPVTASYLGQSFPLETLHCPGCGRVHVAEALATGKMARVEQLLEDK